MNRALGVALCIVLLGGMESAAGQQEAMPRESVSVDASQADGKEILYLIPTGNDSSKTRAYLKQLCGWITRTEEIRSRYSLVYVSSHMERPLDEARAELSDGTEIRRPQEKKPDSSKAGGSSSASEPPKLSAEDQELLRRIDSAQQLLSGTGPLWDVRGRLSECYSAQNESAADTRTLPPRSTVLIAEYVDLGSHGKGLSFVKLSSQLGEKAHYDFVQLSGTENLSDAVRLLAAAALRPKEMTAAKVEIKAHIQEQDRCPSSSGQDCLLQTGSARITISAKDSPFVRAGQVELPDISERDFGEVNPGHIDITERVSSKGQVEANVHFRRSGTYTLRIQVRTQISASEEVTDVFDHVFHVKPQSLVLDEQTGKTAEYSEELLRTSPWERDKEEPPPLERPVLPYDPFSRWRVMPAADFVTLADRIHDELMLLDPPKADTDFGPIWKRHLERALHHDSIRDLLAFYVVSQGGTLIRRERVWCLRLVDATVWSMSRERPGLVTTAEGEDLWITACSRYLSKELDSLRGKIQGYERIQRFHLRYKGVSPRSFRVIEALANRESVELQPSELVLSQIPLTVTQLEELQLTALTPETVSAPVPMRLDIYTLKSTQFTVEAGVKLEQRKGYHGQWARDSYLGMRVLTPILLKETLAASLHWQFFDAFNHSADREQVEGIFFPIEKVGSDSDFLVGAAIYPLALVRLINREAWSAYRPFVWDVNVEYSLYRGDFCVGTTLSYSGRTNLLLGLTMQTNLARSRGTLGISAGFRL